MVTIPNDENVHEKQIIVTESVNESPMLQSSSSGSVNSAPVHVHQDVEPTAVPTNTPAPEPIATIGAYVPPTPIYEATKEAKQRKQDAINTLGYCVDGVCPNATPTPVPLAMIQAAHDSSMKRMQEWANENNMCGTVASAIAVVEVCPNEDAVTPTPEPTPTPSAFDKLMDEGQKMANEAGECVTHMFVRYCPTK